MKFALLTHVLLLIANPKVGAFRPLTSSAFRRSYTSSSALNMVSPTLGSFVKAEISFSKAGQPVETPYDEGIVSFCVNGGRYFPEINTRAEVLPIGETSTFSVQIGEYNEELAANIPAENAPPGLRVGDVVRLSNGMKVRVTDVSATVVRIDANPPLAGQVCPLHVLVSRCMIFTRFMGFIASQALDVSLKVLERFPHTSLSQITVAAGCFWGLELRFQRVRGVCYTAVGYTHGAKAEPTYEVQYALASCLFAFASCVCVCYSVAFVHYFPSGGLQWGHRPRRGRHCAVQPGRGVIRGTLEGAFAFELRC